MTNWENDEYYMAEKKRQQKIDREFGIYMIIMFLIFVLLTCYGFKKDNQTIKDLLNGEIATTTCTCINCADNE